MNNIIIYASKYGATKIIAQKIKDQLNGITEIYNIKDKIPNLSKYDTVIIGGSIYMNKIQKSITRYLNRHEKELLNKNLGLFIGCYTAPSTEGYLKQFFPEKLYKTSKAKDILGGIMQYDKMNFAYRKTFQLLKKIDDFNKNFVEPKIEIDTIKRFAQNINK